MITKNLNLVNHNNQYYAVIYMYTSYTICSKHMYIHIYNKSKYEIILYVAFGVLQ